MDPTKFTQLEEKILGINFIILSAISIIVYSLVIWVKIFVIKTYDFVGIYD
jgi:hypothetical protein